MNDNGETLVRSSELAQALRERDEARRVAKMLAENLRDGDEPTTSAARALLCVAAMRTALAYEVEP